MNKLFSFLLIVPFVLLTIAGCGENSFEPEENSTPETGLAITGQELANTLYRVELKWWGSDADGEVNGYQYRWTPLEEGAETFELDTAWTYTGFVKKEFLVPVTDSLAGYHFEVRAVDNLGAVDPSPAGQDYPFYNNPPWAEIRFIELLPDSAWPVIAFGWNAYDPDGDSTIAQHLVWMKGREDSPFEFAADVDTVLLLPADIDTSGDVTIFYQAVDEGHSASTPDSFNIHLYEIRGDLLLVDDNYGLSTSIIDCDKFYLDFVSDRMGSEDNFTLLNVDSTPFDTDVRLEGLFTAFDQIIWYTGQRQKSRLEDDAVFNQLALCERGFKSFVSGGGDLFLSSLNAVGTYGALSSDFYRNYVGLDTLYIYWPTASSNFEFLPAVPPVLPACEVVLQAVEGTGLPDLYLQCPIQYTGIDSPVDTTDAFRAERLYMFPTGIFKEQPGDFYPLVRYDVPDPAGEVILSTLPFSLYYGGENGEENWASAFTALLDWLDNP